MTRNGVEGLAGLCIRGRAKAFVMVAFMCGVAPVAAGTEELVFTERLKLTASDAVLGDSFGYWVDLDDDLAMVGAPFGGAGAAYLFERNAGGPGQWGEVAKLTASEGEPGDWLGLRVAVDGDTALAGAPVNEPSRQGYAYLFERDAGGAGEWGAVAKLTPSDGEPDDGFGMSVAIDGDLAVVGAIFANGPTGGETGAVYIYERNAGGPSVWAEVSRLVPGSACDENTTYCGWRSDNLFGSSVAVSGDTILVGSSNNYAYVFRRESSGSWRRVGRPRPADVVLSVNLGGSVAISGDTALLGAYEDQTFGGSSGTAYVFKPGAFGQLPRWDEEAKLLAPDGEEGDQVGRRVSLDGDIAALGAPQMTLPHQWKGEAYAFRRTRAGQWQPVANLVASDGEDYDKFGWSIAVSGRTVLVGADGDDDFGESSGSAYLFEPSTLADVPDSSRESERVRPTAAAAPFIDPPDDGTYCFKPHPTFGLYCDGIEVTKVGDELFGTWVRLMEAVDCTSDLAVAVSGSIKDGVVRLRCDLETDPCPADYSWEWIIDHPFDGDMIMAQEVDGALHSWFDQLAYTVEPGSCLIEGPGRRDAMQARKQERPAEGEKFLP